MTPPSAPAGASQGASRPRPRLRSLRARLLLSFLLVALVPLALLAGWSLHSTSITIDRITRDALLDECALGSLELEKAVTAAQADLFFLTQMPSLKVLLRAGPGQREAHSLATLGRDFATLIAPNPRYAGAAYVDEVGEEVVRVQRAREAVQILPAERLRTLGLDSLYRQAMQLVAGKMLIGPLELADPGQPASGAVLRFFIRVFDDGNHRRGAVVLELRTETVLEQLRVGGVAAERLLLIDPRGVYLEHPRPPGSARDAPWRLDLGERFPGLIRLLESQVAEVIEAQDGTVIALRPIVLAGTASSWHMATVRSLETVRAPVARARRAALAVVLFALVLAAALGLMTAARVSRPLLALARDASRLGHGDFSTRLEARTGDEIEQLADAMNAMSRELASLYQGLEQRIRDKTYEISEAHQRLQIAYDDLAQTHRRLQESEAELVQAEKLSSIGRLAASVAHEINNPAGIVSMYAQMLREDASDPQARTYLDLIIESATKISRTVRALLDFSRRSPLEPQRVEIFAAVEAALAELRARDPGLAVEFNVNIDPVLTTEGDGSQLTQVFRNLAENASHATGGRGRVEIRAVTVADRIRITVEDDGPGIPAEVLPRIFEPFFTTRRGASGTGLGLFICYGIIRDHRGSLRAENRDEGGARFVIEVPVRVENARPPT